MSKNKVEWEWKKLKDICEKGSSSVKQGDLKGVNGDYPIYGASGFIQNVDFFQQSQEYIGIVKDGSGVGRTMLLPAKSSVIGTLQYILPKEGNSLKFINYALQNFDFSKLIQGAAIPHIYFKDYGEMDLAVPPIDEQKRIVKVLDETFEKIEKIKANAQANLQNAKDLFQTTLAQELTITDEKIKQGWSNSTLSDSCTKIVDGTHHSPINTTKGDYQYITAKNIRKDGIDLSNITYVSKDIHEEIYARCNPIKGDVLLIKDGATTGIAVINNLDYEFSLLSSVALLKTDSKRLNAPFLVFLLNSDGLQKQMRGKMDGAAITRLTLVKIKELQIPLPPLPIQKQIVAKLDALSEKVKQLESNYKQILADCEELKKAVLKKAFNGNL